MVLFVLKRLLIASLFVASLSTTAFAENVVFVTTDQYPPYLFTTKDGRFSGIYTETIREIDARVDGYDIEISVLPWARALKSVETGDAVAIFPPHELPDERPYLSPYSSAIAEEVTAIFCREDVFAAAPRISVPEDFHNLDFVNPRGIEWLPKSISDAANEGKLSLKLVSSADVAVRMLIKSRADCYVSDRETLAWKLRELSRTEQYSPQKDGHIKQGPVLSVLHPKIGYTNRDQGRFPFKADLIQKIDKAINDMKADGAFARIRAQFVVDIEH